MFLITKYYYGIHAGINRSLSLFITHRLANSDGFSFSCAVPIDLRFKTSVLQQEPVLLAGIG